jgi:hypothetical protein
MIACGAGIVFDRKARSSAAVLGTAINFVVLVVYVPLLVAQPSVAVGLNYFADTLAFGGTVLLLAGALDRGLAAGKQAPREEPMA